MTTSYDALLIVTECQKGVIEPIILLSHSIGYISHDIACMLYHLFIEWDGPRVCVQNPKHRNRRQPFPKGKGKQTAEEIDHASALVTYKKNLSHLLSVAI
jgi:hypothetical protein